MSATSVDVLSSTKERTMSKWPFAAPPISAVFAILVTFFKVSTELDQALHHVQIFVEGCNSQRCLSIFSGLVDRHFATSTNPLKAATARSDLPVVARTPWLASPHAHLLHVTSARCLNNHLVRDHQ
jgi:hypothetical protein